GMPSYLSVDVMRHWCSSCTVGTTPATGAATQDPGHAPVNRSQSPATSATTTCNACWPVRATPPSACRPMPSTPRTSRRGMGARAALVIHHLELLAGFAADRTNRQWRGRLDMSHVILVGHSRGGEGVDQAAIESPWSAPYRLAGQVLIAPTDFSYQTAPYLPT